tara:strand:- start:107 stop:349 length:243 start_codon:yes stop_codon:yes gene_type:complete
MRLGEILKAARFGRGLSQEQAAELLSRHGVDAPSKQSVCNYEAGRRLLGPALLLAYAEAFQLDLAVLCKAAAREDRGTRR